MQLSPINIHFLFLFYCLSFPLLLGFFKNNFVKEWCVMICYGLSFISPLSLFSFMFLFWPCEREGKCILCTELYFRHIMMSEICSTNISFSLCVSVCVLWQQESSPGSFCWGAPHYIRYLKEQFTPKWQFCQHLLTLMSFQTSKKDKKNPNDLFKVFWSHMILLCEKTDNLPPFQLSNLILHFAYLKCRITFTSHWCIKMPFFPTEKIISKLQLKTTSMVLFVFFRRRMNILLCSKK